MYGSKYVFAFVHSDASDTEQAHAYVWVLMCTHRDNNLEEYI